jgi:hypothetical protein
MSSTEKPVTTTKDTSDKLSEIFDWKMLMSVKGDSKGIYYSRVAPNKSGMMGMARIDMTKKVVAHFHDVRPVEYFLKSNSGRFFDLMHENVKDGVSLELASIKAIEEVNKLIVSEYQEAKDAAKAKNEIALPPKPEAIQMYDSRRFVNWYIFINQVLAEMTNKPSTANIK